MLSKPEKMILTAGPSISEKEISYVMDAVKNGWNEHFNDYVEKFEHEFAKYTGAKYAVTTSGGTWAFLLACAACGIGKGDEVIFPDLAYFSVTDVVVQLGAKPVFVDVEKESWCIDPQKIKKAITKKTKAIAPVNMYGNMPLMYEILDIAQKHNLYIIEDSCPALGSTYLGKHAGTFGDFGCFSFQGAKIATAGGLGGMLITDNEKLFETAKYFNRQGESYSRKFFQTQHGYCFDMTNMQAAMGLAQLERIEEFVEKKRQINVWYKEYLGNIEGITLNSEKEGERSNKWMSSIVLNGEFPINRDELRIKLKEEKIDTRPFFYPVCVFPMYKAVNNPISQMLSKNGMNLPSGVHRTKEEIEYICYQIRKLLHD